MGDLSIHLCANHAVPTTITLFNLLFVRVFQLFCHQALPSSIVKTIKSHAKPRPSNTACNDMCSLRSFLLIVFPGKWFVRSNTGSMAGLG